MMDNTTIIKYKNALVEVEAVLSCLRYEDYCKIPSDIISQIQNNKNEKYIYEYDKDLDYVDWNLMPETKAILYNILKKYLVTDEQLEYFKMKEHLEIMEAEQEKSKLYGSKKLFKDSKNIKEKVDSDTSMQLQIVNENGLWYKIKKLITRLLKK